MTDIIIYLKYYAIDKILWNTKKTLKPMQYKRKITALVAFSLAYSF